MLNNVGLNLHRITLSHQTCSSRLSEFSSPVVSLGGNQPIHEAETNKTIIRCATTSGYPRPNITWYRNGLELNLNAIGSEDECRINGFHYLENHRPPHAEYLVLCRPSHVKNTGFYKCSATNKIGANSSEGFLNVLGEFNQQYFLICSCTVKHTATGIVDL